MDIHFISSLNPDDEDRFAPVLLQAVRPLLDMLPIAYTLRIQTSNNRVLQHTRTELPDVPDEEALTFPPGAALRSRSTLS